MAKFNTKSVVEGKVTNLASGKAYAESPELEFVTLLLTSFVRDQFYRKESDTLDRIAELLEKGVEPEFAAKSAVYARNQCPFVRNMVVRVDGMM